MKAALCYLQSDRCWTHDPWRHSMVILIYNSYLVQTGYHLGPVSSTVLSSSPDRNQLHNI